MYTIGAFAAFGRVSARMLRHYDAIGLLRPAEVDGRSGYRRYARSQLVELLRIVELRSVGCGLDEIAAVLAADDPAEAMAAALRRRRDAIEADMAADAALLRRIDDRLRIIEGDPAMPQPPVEYRPIEPVTVYALQGRTAGMGPEHVGPLIDQELLPRLTAALQDAGRPMLEPGVFWYEGEESGEGLVVTVAFTAEAEPVPGEGYAVVELPAVELAAVLVHHGAPSGIGEAWHALTDRLLADGYLPSGPAREVYLDADDALPMEQWVTELQQPVQPA